MNDYSETGHSFDPRVLDRLIDGELAETERREVLLTLDRQPDGWRHCALAFLEAQTWGQTLTHYVRTPNESLAGASISDQSQFGDGGNLPAPHDAARQESPRIDRGEAARNGRWRSWLAIAGSFLVTFSLGMYAQRYLRPSSESGQTASLTTPLPAPAASGGGMQIMQMTITTRDGRQQVVQVPVVDNQFAPFFMQPQVPAMPDNVRAALARVGGQLQFKREFVTVPIGNRQALVPIDRIEIVPVGNRVMQ